MSKEDHPATIFDVPTPCLLVDIDKVKRNCQRMIDTAKTMGVHFRPHMKTHKTIEGGEISTGYTKKSIAVSTLSEAEFFADNGYDDILLAVPLSKHKIPRCQKLIDRLESFHVMYDSMETLGWIKDAAQNQDRQWSVVLKIDTGYGRSGVLWDSDDVIGLAKAAQDATNVTFLGVYTHCGSSYDCRGEKELKTYGKENTNKLLTVKQRLEDDGIVFQMVATGSTPSCSKPAENMGGLTEFHPGNYVFYDVENVLIGSCTIDDVALRVATRVISQRPSLNQVVIDCGFTGMSHDGMKQLRDKFCRIQDHPDLRIVDFSQEVGKVRPAEGDLDMGKYPLGTMLFLYPYHACATAAMHPVYYVHEGERIVDVWKPCRGW